MDVTPSDVEIVTRAHECLTERQDALRAYGGRHGIEQLVPAKWAADGVDPLGRIRSLKEMPR